MGNRRSDSLVWSWVGKAFTVIGTELVCPGVSWSWDGMRDKLVWGMSWLPVELTIEMVWGEELVWGMSWLPVELTIEMVWGRSWYGGWVDCLLSWLLRWYGGGVGMGDELTACWVDYWDGMGGGVGMGDELTACWVDYWDGMGEELVWGMSWLPVELTIEMVWGRSWYGGWVDCLLSWLLRWYGG